MLRALPVALASALLLTACGGNADDQAAENITAMTENKADALEDQADATGNEALDDQADATRDAGEDAAERADDNDDARVENEVANTM